MFWITLACIVVPHVLMAVVDVSWVWLDRKNASTSRRRFILGCLTFGRIVRYGEYVPYVTVCFLDHLQCRIWFLYTDMLFVHSFYLKKSVVYKFRL